MSVFIDRKKCNGISVCSDGGLCIELCALNAMKENDDRPQVIDENCTECGLCLLNCPNEAIFKQ